MIEKQIQPHDYREAVFVLPKRIWNRNVTDEVDADIVSKYPL